MVSLRLRKMAKRIAIIVLILLVFGIGWIVWFKNKNPEKLLEVSTHFTETASSDATHSHSVPKISRRDFWEAIGRENSTDAKWALLIQQTRENWNSPTVTEAQVIDLTKRSISGNREDMELVLVYFPEAISRLKYTDQEIDRVAKYLQPQEHEIAEWGESPNNEATRRYLHQLTGREFIDYKAYLDYRRQSDFTTQSATPR